MAKAKWLEDRQSELLAVPYFHLVFTVPQSIAAIAYQNKQRLYNILFQAASETLRTIAADPKHLGAEIGFFAVLHTWGILLSLVAAFLSTARAGFPADLISFYRFACCRVCSVACS